MRVVGGVLGVVLALSACGGDPFTSAAPKAPSVSTTAPASRAVADPTSSTRPVIDQAPPTTAAPESIPMSTEPTGASLPDGMTTADLPDDPGERLGMMTDWLDDQFPERTSGHAYFQVDGVYNLTFNIDVADEGDARALCPFYVELTALYLADSAESVSLNGWVLDESGRFGEADWDRLHC